MPKASIPPIYLQTIRLQPWFREVAEGRIYGENSMATLEHSELQKVENVLSKVLDNIVSLYLPGISEGEGLPEGISTTLTAKDTSKEVPVIELGSSVQNHPFARFIASSVRRTRRGSVDFQKHADGKYRPYFLPEREVIPLKSFPGRQRAALVMSAVALETLVTAEGVTDHFEITRSKPTS